MRYDATRADAAGGQAPALLLAACLAAALAAPAEAQPRAPDRAPDGLEGQVAAHRGYPVLPASSLAGAGRPLADLRVEGPRLRAALHGRPVELLAESPFYRLGGRVRQLPNAPYRRGGEFWIPLVLLPAEAAGGAGSSASGRGPGEAATTVPSGPWKVVIDPGHGGRDPGARGPRGTREKEVVLAIAREVRERLDRRDDIEATLTRDGDEFLPLDERSRIAVRRGAHLFLSIHANAARARRARGFETYFLGEARTEESRRVALRENAAVQYQEDSEWSPEEQVAYILASADQRAYVVESNYVAGYLQNELRRRHTGPDRGVKQGPFYVLMAASGSMPAVLVETGFISNPSGERLLADPSGQARVAEGIAEAVVTYFRERERRAAVRTARR